MSKRKLCEACGSSNLFQGMDGEAIFTKCNRCCHMVWRKVLPRKKENQMNITPLYDRVIVEPIYQDDVTEGGIYIPEQAKEKPMRGTVLAVGIGKRDAAGAFQPPILKVGDVVLYGKFAGSRVVHEKKELLLLKEEDVFGIVKE